MRIPIKGMSLAMEKISDLAASDSNAPGVLLKIRQGEMDVCYSNGRRAVMERLEIVQEDGDIDGDIVVSYKRLADIIATLQPSGRITTSDITVTFESQERSGIMEVTATKHLVMFRENGGSAGEEGQGQQVTLEDGEQADDTAPREDFDSAEYMEQAGAGFELHAAQGVTSGNEGSNESGTEGTDGTEGKPEENDGDYVEEICKVSEFRQKLNYFDPSAEKIKYGILTRMNYDDIFVGDDGETHNDFDVWDVNELREMLTRMALEKNRTIYASHAQGAVYVVNLAYASWVATESVVDNGFTCDTGLAKNVVDILGSMAKSGAKQVLVKKKDNRYVCMADENCKMGLWFEMAPPNRTDSATLMQYKSKEYMGYRVLFSREAMENVLMSAMATDKVEKTTLGFHVDGENVAMRITSVNSGSSVSNTFDVIGYGQCLGMDVMLKEKLVVSLKTISDMVKNCTGDFIELAVDIPEGKNDRYLRFGDVEFGDTGYIPADSVLTCAHYSIASAV